MRSFDGLRAYIIRESADLLKEMGFVMCPKCQGHGKHTFLADMEIIRCAACNGKGAVPEAERLEE